MDREKLKNKVRKMTTENLRGQLYQYLSAAHALGENKCVWDIKKRKEIPVSNPYPYLRESSDNLMLLIELLTEIAVERG